MAGKMTILDRLMKEGRIKPGIGITEVQDELNSNVADQAPLLEYGFEPADLDFDTPRADLRDFWPSYQESPEWFESEAGAYNRLRARGLSDPEARMYIRERFGR